MRNRQYNGFSKCGDGYERAWPFTRLSLEMSRVQLSPHSSAAHRLKCYFQYVREDGYAHQHLNKATRAGTIRTLLLDEGTLIIALHRGPCVCLFTSCFTFNFILLSRPSIRVECLQSLTLISAFWREGEEEEEEEGGGGGRGRRGAGGGKITGNLVRQAAEMQRGIGGTALLQDHFEYVNSAAFLELS